MPASLLVPSELLLPATDPIGLRLLRLMGWREGQGVGPRRKRQRARVEGGAGENNEEQVC